MTFVIQADRYIHKSHNTDMCSHVYSKETPRPQGIRCHVSYAEQVIGISRLSDTLQWLPGEGTVEGEHHLLSVLTPLKTSTGPGLEHVLCHTLALRCPPELLWRKSIVSWHW